MTISDLKKAYRCRNLVLVITVIYCLWFLVIVNAKVPLKVNLSISNGEVKEISRIYKKDKIAGCELNIDDNFYIIKWLDFSIDEKRLSKILSDRTVTILYEKSFFVFGENRIYEISTENGVVFTYDFFVQHYLSDKSKKITLFPYVLLLCLICLAALQFSIYKKISLKKGKSLH